MLRSTRFEVDLGLVAHNFRLVRERLKAGPPARDGAPPRICAVLKGNAYGLGALAAAGELLAAGAHMLAVACLTEALELRGQFPTAAILVMGHTPTEYLAECARARLRTTLFDLEQARALSEASVQLERRTPVFVKIDAGMNRLGIKPDQHTAALIAEMAGLEGIRLEGLFTQLPYREPGSDHACFQVFRQVAGEAEAAGVRFPIHSASESLAVLRHPEFALDLVRVGALLFGVEPRGIPLPGIRTPFALRSRISRLRALREGEGVSYDSSWRAREGSRIATVPAGYADGYCRRLSNQAQAVVRGRRVPVVGLVTMDQLFLDVSGLPECREGDEVLLLGRHGEDEVGVAEVADWAGLHRNEVLSMVGRRVPRLYLKNGKVVGEADYLVG
jgi:alanine racemase